MKLKGVEPQIGENVFLAESAEMIGDVVLGDESSVWFQSVLRGDVAPIRIGRESNIQDRVVIHGTYQKCGVNIGDRVSVGHGAILHGCSIDDETLVGMGAIIMDEASIGRRCLVAAGSLVTEGASFKEGQLILGQPAKAVRALTEKEKEFLTKSSQKYLMYKEWYQKEGGHGVRA